MAECKAECMAEITTIEQRTAALSRRRSRTRSRSRLLALAIAGAIALLAAACSSADDGEAGRADSTPDGLQSSEPVEQPDPSGTEGVDEDASTEENVATNDGSASASEAATDIWTMVGGAALVPDGSSAQLDEIAADGDGGLLIGGRIVDYRERLTRAAIWQSAGDPASDLIRLELPTLADGVTSAVASVVVPAPGSGPATDGITAMVGGRVGEGPGRRAAVWVARGERWEQVASDAFAAVTQEWASTMVIGEDTSYLIGGTLDAGGQIDPTVWSSPDGTSWTRLTERFDQRRASTIVDGAQAEVGTVLIGHHPAEGFDRSQLWLSADGREWEHIEPPSFSGEGSVFVSSIVAAPSGGFVAVGSLGDADGVFQPASWTSADGRTWSEPSTAFEQNDLDRFISTGFGATHLTTDGAGFVATGTAPFLQHVWRSDDGVIWTPAGNILDVDPNAVSVSSAVVAGETVSIVGDGRLIQGADDSWRDVGLATNVVPQPNEVPWINDIVTNGTGFLAVGGVEDRRGETQARAWVSEDLQLWREVENAGVPAQYTTSGPYSTAVTTPDGYLATSPETTANSRRRNRFGRTNLHTITGGEIRRPASFGTDAGRVVLGDVAVVGDRVLMAGLLVGPETVEATLVEGFLRPDAFDRLVLRGNDSQIDLDLVQIETPGEADDETWSQLCASPGNAVAVLRQNDPPATSVTFFHRDATGAWSRATGGPVLDPAGASTWINDCIHGQDGFLAAGGTERDPDDGDDDGSLWLSADGTSWTEIDAPEATVDPATDAWIGGLAVFEDRYLLVGSVDTDGLDTGTLWIGSPDTGWTEIPASNDPNGFNISGIAVDDAGTVVIAGWQDGQATVVSAPIEDLLALG